MIPRLERCCVPVIQNRNRTERKREIEMRSHFGSGEARRRHPDDLQWMILYHQSGADRGETPAEFPLPQSVTQNHRWRRTTSYIVLGAEQPAGGRRNSEPWKEVAGHSNHGHAARLGAPPHTQACISAVPGKHRRKRLLVFPDLLEQRVTEIVAILQDAEV